MVAFDENDIRPRELMEDKQACVEADREYLLGRHNEWVRVSCPACDFKENQQRGQKAGFTYVECRRCATVYTSPRPSRQVLDDFYASSQNYEYWNKHIFPATESTRREKIFRPRVDRVLDMCERLGVVRETLLEIGAGFGIFCEEMVLRSAFDRVIALELTPDLAETCRRRGLEVLQMPVEDLEGNEHADVIVSFEVLEHLFSPKDFVQRCRNLLRPHGLLVVTCPNVQGFDVATLGMLSNTFDHEHINYFHTKSLPLLLERFGFEVVDVQTPGRLDADIVRTNVLAGKVDLNGQPLLQEVLLDGWEEHGEAFQTFLAKNRLSSHMWVLARKAAEE